MYIYIHIHVHIHVYVYIYIYIYMYTCFTICKGTWADRGWVSSASRARSYTPMRARHFGLANPKPLTPTPPALDP